MDDQMLKEVLIIPEIKSFIEDMDMKVSNLMREEFKRHNFIPIQELVIRYAILKHMYEDSKETLEFVLLNTIK